MAEVGWWEIVEGGRRMEGGVMVEGREGGGRRVGGG